MTTDYAHQDVPARRMPFAPMFRRPNSWQYVAAGVVLPKIYWESVLSELEIPEDLPLLLPLSDGQTSIDALLFLDGVEQLLWESPFRSHYSQYYAIRRLLIMSLVSGALGDQAATAQVTLSGISLPFRSTQLDAQSLNPLCPGCGGSLRQFFLLNDREVRSFRCIKQSKTPDSMFALNPFTGYIYDTAYEADLRFCWYCVPCAKTFSLSLDERQLTACRKNGRVDWDAMRRYDELAFVTGDSGMSHDDLARLLQQGRAARAAIAARAILSTRGDDAAALTCLGVAYEMRRRHLLAEECFRRVVELRGDSLQAKKNLAGFYFARDELDKAQQCGVPDSQSLIDAFFPGAVTEASPAGPADEEHQLGRAYFVAKTWQLPRLLESRRWDEAKTLMSRFAPLEERNQDVLLLAAYAAFWARDYDGVITRMLQLADRGWRLEKAPGYLEESRNRRCCDPGTWEESNVTFLLRMKDAARLSDRGKYKEALEAIEEALRIFPESSAAWTEKGNFLHALHDRAEAQACYGRALELNPLSPYLLYNYAVFVADSTLIVDLNRAYVLAGRAAVWSQNKQAGDRAERLGDRLAKTLKGHFATHHDEGFDCPIAQSNPETDQHERVYAGMGAANTCPTTPIRSAVLILP